MDPLFWFAVQDPDLMKSCALLGFVLDKHWHVTKTVMETVYWPSAELCLVKCWIGELQEHGDLPSVSHPDFDFKFCPAGAQTPYD